MKLFGTALFTFKKPAEPMYDFAQHGLVQANFDYGQNVMWTANIVQEAGTPKQSKKATEEKPAPLVSPKELYKMKALNKNDFVIRNDPAYLKEQIEVIDEKLSFMGQKKKKKRRVLIDDIMPQPSFGGVVYGRLELESVRERLENRLRMGEFQGILDKYPHTSSELISDVLTNHTHLRCQRADDFVPDFPREAMRAMKEYDQMCQDLCNKKAIFYVVAKQEDFERKNKRRDPILLAQSPFGHFWQILGAWDEEMVYLGDL